MAMSLSASESLLLLLLLHDDDDAHDHCARVRCHSSALQIAIRFRSASRRAYRVSKDRLIISPSSSSSPSIETRACAHAVRERSATATIPRQKRSLARSIATCVLCRFQNNNSCDRASEQASKRVSEPASQRNLNEQIARVRRSHNAIDVCVCVRFPTSEFPYF